MGLEAGNGPLARGNNQKVNTIKCSTSDLFYIKTNVAEAMNKRKLSEFGGSVVHLSLHSLGGTCHCTLGHYLERCTVPSGSWISCQKFFGWFLCIVLFWIKQRIMFPSVGYTLKREFSSYYRSLQHDKPQEFVTSQVITKVSGSEQVQK